MSGTLYAKLKDRTLTSYVKVNKILDHKVTQYQEVLIAELDGLGKTLILNNELQTCHIDYIPYHEAIVHSYKPLNWEKVLVLGSGEGCSVDLLIRRGWKHIDAVDIDHQAIELIDKHLSDWNHNIYKRQDEFNLIIDDGLEILKATPDYYYSYIILDLTSEAILENQEEWIAHIHRCLLPNGLLGWQDGNKYSFSYMDKIVREHFQTEPVLHTMLEWRFGQISKKDSTPIIS